MHATLPKWRPIAPVALGLNVFVIILLGATMGQAESAEGEAKLESAARKTVDISQADKRAAIAEIVRLHKEKREQLVSRFRSDKNEYPGSLFGYMRDMNRIDQERYQELARVLTPEELEDFEFEECTLVRHHLSDGDVTTEQQRAVCRILRDSLNRNPAPKDDSLEALLEFRRAGLETDQRILKEVGPVVSAAWLRRMEGDKYLSMAKLVETHELPFLASLELWRIRYQFKVRQLELEIKMAGQGDGRYAAFEALIREYEVRIIGIIGKDLFEAEGGNAFRWLREKSGSW